MSGAAGNADDEARPLLTLLLVGAALGLVLGGVGIGIALTRDPLPDLADVDLPEGFELPEPPQPPPPPELPPGVEPPALPELPELPPGMEPPTLPELRPVPGAPGDLPAPLS